MGRDKLSEKYGKENIDRYFDLFEMLDNTGCKFAISEFDNDFVMNQAKERKLNVIYIGERTNLKNKRTEILITNYENAPTLFS